MKTIVNSWGVKLNWAVIEEHILCEIDNLAERLESTPEQITYDLEKDIGTLCLMIALRTLSSILTSFALIILS